MILMSIAAWLGLIVILGIIGAVCLLNLYNPHQNTIMAVKTKQGAWGSTQYVESIPKKTRQGRGPNTKYAASSRNSAKKKYRGQGK